MITFVCNPFHPIWLSNNSSVTVRLLIVPLQHNHYEQGNNQSCTTSTFNSTVLIHSYKYNNQGNSPYHPFSPLATSIANPKSASLTAAPGFLLDSKRFSGYGKTPCCLCNPRHQKLYLDVPMNDTHLVTIANAFNYLLNAITIKWDNNILSCCVE